MTWSAASGILASALLLMQSPGEMVQVPAGSYQPLYRGKEVPPRIEVHTFLMDVHPVTNAEYLAFVQEYPQWQRSKVKPIFAESTYLKYWAGDVSFDPTLANAPVTNVSWFAARKYCECQGKRLATSDEWEYTATASETAASGTDDAAFNQRLLEWYSKPNPRVTPNVGSTFRNHYGIWDLHSLVWEWVEDFNSALITGDSRADTETSSNFFCGSGALGANDFKNYAAFLRYGFRGSLKANYCINNLGFRCAKDVES